MQNSHILALLLNVALGHANFLSPVQGDRLNLNEAINIRWGIEGLTGPLNINLVPSGPEDFVVAQQVAVALDNLGELEWIPDASIAAFETFQLVLTDALNNAFSSDPFVINDLIQQPVVATVTVPDVQAVPSTVDGAVVTEFVTRFEIQVASIPADPIRIFVSAGQTVNAIATGAPVAAVFENLANDGLQLAEDVLGQGALDFSDNFNGVAIANALTVSLFAQATPTPFTVTLNPLGLGGAGIGGDGAVPVSFAPVGSDDGAFSVQTVPLFDANTDIAGLVSSADPGAFTDPAAFNTPLALQPVPEATAAAVAGAGPLSFDPVSTGDVNALATALPLFSNDTGPEVNRVSPINNLAGGATGFAGATLTRGANQPLVTVNPNNNLAGGRFNQSSLSPFSSSLGFNGGVGNGVGNNLNGATLSAGAGAFGGQFGGGFSTLATSVNNFIGGTNGLSAPTSPPGVRVSGATRLSSTSGVMACGLAGLIAMLLL